MQAEGSSPIKIIYQGWLWKCPHTLKLLTTKWCRRWFYLELSGSQNEFIVLKQFSSPATPYCSRMWTMNMCEELRTGTDLKYRRQSYPFSFGFKVLSEWHYMAADSELEMNVWVKAITLVCGLKKLTAAETVDSKISLSDRWRSKLKRAFSSEKKDEAKAGASSSSEGTNSSVRHQLSDTDSDSSAVEKCLTKDNESRLCSSISTNNIKLQ